LSQNVLEKGRQLVTQYQPPRSVQRLPSSIVACGTMGLGWFLLGKRRAVTLPTVLDFKLENIHQICKFLKQMSF
jgi:hypothetical protein